MLRDNQRIRRFPVAGAGRGWFVATLCAVSAIGAFGAARAVDGITLVVEVATGAGWSIADLTVDLTADASGLRGRARVAELNLADIGVVARDLDVTCGALELSGSRVACRQARLVGDVRNLGVEQASGTLTYDRATGDVEVALTGLSLASGRAKLDASLRAAGWAVDVAVTRADAAGVAGLVARIDERLAITPTAGSLDFAVMARGSHDTLNEVEFTATVLGLSAGNEPGTVASDGLDATARGSLRRERRGWQFALSLDAPGGQAYVEPVFVDLAGGALRARAIGRYDEAGGLAIERFDVDHRDSLRAHGSARLSLEETWAVDALDVTFAEIVLPGAWGTYLAPFLVDSSFANLATSGRLTGRLDVVDGAPAAVDFVIDSVTVDDGTGSLAIAALSGDIHWTSSESSADVEDETDDTTTTVPPVSTLSWASGSLFGLALGPSELRFTARGLGLRLTEEATIPVLDGAIDLEAFRIRNLGQDNVAFLIGAEIRPISVALMCRAFGWPEFGGTLAGTIRKLRMRDGVVSLGTTLAAQVFDGEIRLSDVRLERPFDDWPRLFANIELERLDLEQVTSAFSFGRITGRLGGRIAGLELFNWMPVTFDADLATPPGDRSKHRISQRAVENIGSLGGSSAGVTAALSTGFLRFFEEFNYDRLGISCRLRNEVCQMGGVAPAEGGGYYLVKGKGLPRIDVIGNRKRVDWPRLVRQLVAITESEGPVVE